MKQLLSFALVIGLMLAPGTVTAQQGGGQAVGRYPIFPPSTPQFAPSPGLTPYGSISPYAPAPYAPPAFIVGPTPRRAWMPAFWYWNGYGWVLIPGHWVWY